MLKQCIRLKILFAFNRNILYCKFASITLFNNASTLFNRNILYCKLTLGTIPNLSSNYLIGTFCIVNLEVGTVFYLQKGI